MNTGVRQQNLPQYNYHEEGEYYNEDDQQNYDQQYENQDDYYEEYEGNQQNYQNSTYQRAHYEDYPVNKTQNTYQQRERDLPRSNTKEDKRYMIQENSNKERVEPGSITETIDANKVKTSKLFQKFLQNENKENPAKLGGQRNTKGHTSPFTRETKDSNKNRSLTPKQKQPFSQNQGQYSPRDQGENYDNYPPQLKERGRRSYEQEDYEPDYRESKSSAENPGYMQNNGEYDYGQDFRNADVDLNQQSSSKLVALQSPGQEAYPPVYPGLQGQPPNGAFLMPNPYPYMGYGMNPEMMKGAPQQQNYQMNNPAEVFVLRSQVMELNQALSREIEANKTLDSRCSEYLSQLEISAQNFEEFKQKIFDQDSGHQEEVRRLQDKIRQLNENLVEKERNEEQQTQELNKLKRKLDSELESRGRLLEEHDDLERRKFEELDRLKREIDEKDEELQRLRRENDSNRHDKDTFKSTEERFMREIRGAKADNIDLQRVNEDLRKQVEDKNQQLNLEKMENNSLRNQLDTMDSQYRELLAENDRAKRDSFYMKEKLLAAESEMKALQLSLEKSQINADQANDALSRVEKALERERRITADLRSQLNAEPPRVNQWDAPRKDYSTNRQEDRTRQYEDDRNERPYSRNEDVQPSRARDTQFAPTKYELRREGSKSFNKQDNDESPFNQRNQEAPTRAQPQRQYSGGYGQESKDQYQEPMSNKYGNQSRGGRNVERDEYSGSNQQQSSYTRENKYEERNRGNAQRNQYTTEEQHGKNTPKNEVNRNQPEVREAGQKTPQNQSGKAVPKMSSNNQVYKPTNNLLVWDEPQSDNKPNPRKVREEKPIERQEEYQTGTGVRRQQTRVPEPQENFLSWEEIPGENKGVNRRGKEVERERQEEGFGGKRPKKTQEAEERGQFNSNKKPTQNQSQTQIHNPSGMIFGKEDNKTPQDLREVKSFEQELMNLQMQRDNLHNELQRLDKVKIKSGANIKRKQEVESELNSVNANISNCKTKLRELNALLPF